MPHTYVYPRHGGMRPGTQQRLIGGFAYGLGCPPAANCVNAGSQLADWHAPLMPLDPTRGWNAMVQRYETPVGGVVKLQGYGQYGTGFGQGAKDAAVADIVRTEIQAKEMRERAESPQVAKRDLADAESALKRAREAFTRKEQETAQARALAAPGSAHRSERATMTLMQREAEREEAAALIIQAKKAQMAARARAAVGALKRLDNAIEVAKERAAAFSASGNTAGANAARARVARLTKLRHRFSGTRSHVEKLLGKLKALEQSHGLANAAAKRHALEAKMLKRGIVPAEEGLETTNTVGPSLPPAVQGGVVADKSPMASVAPVVASPVMQGYAGFGQDITAAEDAAQLEADAAVTAERAATVVINGGDAHDLLTETEQLMDDASRMQRQEMQEPLVPGVSSARAGLLSNPMVMVGLAAVAAFFFLRR